MHRHRSLVVATLFGGLLAMLPAPARQAFAAADNTLGVAIMAADISTFETAPISESGVTGFTKISTGVVDVVFDRYVYDRCFKFTSARGTLHASADFKGSAEPNTIEVSLIDNAGDPQDGRFDLLVYCAY